MGRPPRMDRSWNRWWWPLATGGLALLALVGVRLLLLDAQPLPLSEALDGSAPPPGQAPGLPRLPGLAGGATEDGRRAAAVVAPGGAQDPDPSFPAAFVTLDVEVVDDAGLPIERAHVFAHWGDARAPGAFTDEAGRCSLRAPVHARCLEVDRVEASPADTRRFALVAYRVLDQAARHVRIVVRTWTSVTGSIVDQDGAPVPGAKILAMDDRSDEGLGDFVGEGTSDGLGKFEFDVASSNPVDLFFDGRVDPPGMVPLRASLRRVRPGEGPVVLRAAPPREDGSLQVHVRDPRGPVGGARVVAYQPPRTIPVGRALTDETGWASLRLPSDWPCWVIVESPTSDEPAIHRRSRVGPVLPDGGHVHVWMAAPSVIRGVVRQLDGRPVARASIRPYAGNRGLGWFTTDAAGRFEAQVDVDAGTPVQISVEWRPDGRPVHRGHGAEVRTGIDDPEIRLHPWSGSEPGLGVISIGREGGVRASTDLPSLDGVCGLDGTR